MGASTSKFKPKAHKHHTYIAGKPSSPGKPTLKFDPENFDPDIVTIKWDPPLFDGGSKITGYLVEHRRTGSPHWVKASPIKVRQCQLTISGLEPGWRYQFRVAAENAVGLSDPSPLSEPLAVFVHRSAAIAPYFVTELDDITVLENEKVEFNVNFEGIPTPKIAWYKDGLEIFSNRCQKISTEGNLSTLLIYEAAISDEAEIKCSATNRVGYAVTKSYLKVEAPPTIRLPRQYDEGLIFEEGEIIRLKVSVAGQPQPFVNWYFNGERIATSNRYDTEYADKTAVLKIKHAERCDRGEYQIQAINELGEDVASVMVTIANKPQPPGKITLSNIFGRSVTLTWPKPLDDGGCKIGSYIIEYYKTGWNVWLKAATCRQLKTTLDDLIEGSQYKFRVKAENPYGVSEPSPETEPIFIPDPKRGLFEAPKSARSTESYISQFRETSPPQTFHHSAEYLAYDKLQAPIKPKRKYKAKKFQEQQIDDAARDEAINYDHAVHRRLTPSPQPSSNLDDTSRTSSELMLVLVPSNEDIPKGSLDLANFAFKHLSNTSVPPPISLSAPELGSEIIFFKPLQRNCVSSTEILHESTIARFYDDMLKEDNLKTLQEKLKLPDRVKSITPINNKLLAQAQIKELKPDLIHDLTKIEHLSDHSVETEPRDDQRTFPEPRRSPSQTRDHVQRILNERTQPKKTQPSIVLPEIAEPSEFVQGRYSPTSGTFHYPDLFMESLSKSPKFKPTSNSMYEVVNELITRQPAETNSHYQPRLSVPEIKLNDDYEIPHSELFASNSSLNDDKDINHRYDSRSSTSSGKNSSTSSTNDYHYNHDWYDESESDTDDSDYEDGENETYHPDSVLSFERALEISNPTKYRSVSPTNDMFLESDSNFGFFNKNYQDNDNYSKSAHEPDKPPKSILKCHRFSEQEDTKPAPATISKTNSQKKQVRIEEPRHIEPPKPEDHDPSRVIINHYSDIVKQYGYVQKPPTKVYLTYDELRAAAQLTDDEASIDQPADHIDRIDRTETIRDKPVQKVSHELEKVKNKVHFVFDFFFDIVMFAFACWLYCFKDERLAIPVIILMIYRQVYDKVKNKIPSFSAWRKEKSS